MILLSFHYLLNFIEYFKVSRSRNNPIDRQNPKHHLNAAEARRDILVPERTTLRYWKRVVNYELYLPSTMGKSPGPLPTFTPEHTAFLQTYYDAKSDATLKEAQKSSLVDRFGISVTQSGLQKNLVNKCGLTMKKLKRISEYRNSDETIASRMNWDSKPVAWTTTNMSSLMKLVSTCTSNVTLVTRVEVLQPRR